MTLALARLRGYDAAMNKQDAIKLLGGTNNKAAEACGITSSAVRQWPQELTKDQIDRVQAALYRKSLKRKKQSPPASTGAGLSGD